MTLLHVGILHYYMAPQPRKLQLNLHHHENLTSHIMPHTDVHCLYRSVG
jgi:hypothetical protein